MNVKQWVLNFFREEEGATVVEYAVMLVLIVVVAIAAITLLGDKVNNAFNKAANVIPNPA